jgi:hypothetical protein
MAGHGEDCTGPLPYEGSWKLSNAAKNHAHLAKSTDSSGVRVSGGEHEWVSPSLM